MIILDSLEFFTPLHMSIMLMVQHLLLFGIDIYYNNLSSHLLKSSYESIQVNKKIYSSYITPGFNDYVKDLHSSAVNAFLRDDYESVIFKRYDIAAGLKATKCDKACGVDGLADEHILHADDLILTILTTIFNAFIIHTYLPHAFM